MYMRYEIVLTVALFQFLMIFPISFYLLSINFVGLFFILFMASGLFTVITLYYPLITINKK